MNPEKKERNKEMLDFWKKGDGKISYAQVGKKFGMTKVGAFKIIQRQLAKKSR